MKKNAKINLFSIKGRVLWLYIKYQLISKLMVAIVVLPPFHFVTEMLIKGSGRTNISSGDYITFFASLSGMPVIISGVLILFLILGVDINTFIILSSLIEENKLKIRAKDIFIAVFKSLKYFFSPIGILLVAFVAIILPLLNAGITIGPLQDFAIPNFISAVIFANPLYLSAYMAILACLAAISIVYIFTLHFILIDNQRISQALNSSKVLIKSYWKNFIADYLWTIVKITALCVVLGFLSIGFVILMTMAISMVYPDNKFLTILVIIAVFELLAFLAFLAVPINIAILTKLFYRYNKLAGKTVSIKFEHNASKIDRNDLYRKIKVRTKLEIITVLVVIFGLNVLMALVAKENFSTLFITKTNIELITHRGGGDLGAENTVYGIQQAINEQASWTEIDVQRTKDGKYIINHDVSFKRVTGVDKKPSEMTLSEINQLKVKDFFKPNNPAQPVATLEDILDLTKEKIGVFVELKGKTADQQMVDDVVKIIKAKNMLDECVILSLDYDIITYTEKKYPEIKTGFLYFFSVGEMKDLQGDYLIMEEREATPENIKAIHQSGKKAIVWTVNTPKSIKRFVHSTVDGIITDHIVRVKEAMEQSNKRTQLEMIIDFFKGQ